METIVEFHAGDRVQVQGNGSAGTIRFVGSVIGKEGEWVGIELDEPQGKNDGSVGGVRYFTCSSNYGLFASKTKVFLLGRDSLASSVDSHTSGGGGGTMARIPLIPKILSKSNIDMKMYSNSPPSSQFTSKSFSPSNLVRKDSIKSSHSKTTPVETDTIVHQMKLDSLRRNDDLGIDTTSPLTSLHGDTLDSMETIKFVLDERNRHLTHLQGKYKVSQEQIQFLSNLVSELEKEKENVLMESGKNLEEQSRKWRDRTLEHEKSMSHWQETISRIEEQLEFMRETNMHLEKERIHLLTDITLKKKELEDKGHELGVSRSQCLNYDEEIQKLKELMMEFALKKEISDKNRLQLEDDYRNVTFAYEATNSELIQSRLEKEEFKCRSEEFLQELERLRHDYDILQALDQKENISNELSEKNQELLSLRHLYTQSEGGLKELRDSYEELKGRLIDVQEQCCATERQKQTLLEENELLRREFQDLMVTIEDTKRDATVLQKNYDELLRLVDQEKLEKDQLRVELERTCFDSETLRTEMAELSQIREVAELTRHEGIHLKNLLHEKEQILFNLESRHSGLQHEMNLLSKEHERLKRNFEELVEKSCDDTIQLPIHFDSVNHLALQNNRIDGLEKSLTSTQENLRSALVDRTNLNECLERAILDKESLELTHRELEIQILNLQECLEHSRMTELQHQQNLIVVQGRLDDSVSEMESLRLENRDHSMSIQATCSQETQTLDVDHVNLESNLPVERRNSTSEWIHESTIPNQISIEQEDVHHQRLTDMEANLIVKSREIDDLKNDLMMRDVELQEVFKELTLVKSHHQEQMNSVDRELQTQRSLMKDLQQQLLTSTTTLEQALSRETKLTRETTDIKTRLGEKVMLLNRIEKELVDSKTHLITTTDLLSSREKESHHLKEERDRLHEQCSQMEHRLKVFTEETSNSVQALQAKLVQLEGENALLQNSLVSASEQRQQQKNQPTTLLSSPALQEGISQESMSSPAALHDISQDTTSPNRDISSHFSKLSTLTTTSSSSTKAYCDYCESSTHKTIDCDRQDEIW